MNLSPTWAAYFSNLIGADQGNLTMHLYSEASSGKTEASLRLNRLVESLDNAFFVADSERTITLLHSPKLLGGTLLRPEKKLMALVGLGATAMAVVLPVENWITRHHTFRTANVERMCECNSADELRELTTEGNTRHVKYHHAGSFFFPAPWLLQKLTQAVEEEGGTNCDPHDLIYAALVAAAEYEAAHQVDDDDDDGDDDDDDYEAGTAKAHAIEFAKWCWGVSKDNVKATYFQLKPADTEVVAHLTHRQQQCIMPSVTGGAQRNSTGTEVAESVITQLTETLAQSTEQAQLSNELQRELIDTKKQSVVDKQDKMKDLDDATLNLLAYAATPADAEHKAEIPESCKKFYQCKTAGLSDNQLRLALEKAGCDDAQYSHGLVQALRSGSFLYTNPNSPNNFTVFAIYPRNTGPDQSDDRQILLHIMASTNTSVSETTQQKLAAQSVAAPQTYQESADQLDSFSVLNKLFFGTASPCMERLTTFLDDFKRDKSSLKQKFDQDTTLAVKMLYAIDTRIQRHLRSCRDATDTMEVVPLQLDDILPEILDGKFHRSLPSAFYTLGDKRKAEDSLEGGNEPGGSETGGNKRRKQKAGGRGINQDSPNAAFALNKQGFIELRHHNKHRVVWGKNTKGEEILMCPRWHSRGYCFTDCHNSDSHVKSEEVPEDKNTAYAAYLVRAGVKKAD